MSMVHLSVGMKRPASPNLLSEPAIIAGMARAALPDSATQWESYVDDYDLIRDTMAKALDGFEDFNRRVRLPLGFRIRQPARELIFHTPTQRAEFSTATLPDVVPAPGMLALGTMRSHGHQHHGGAIAGDRALEDSPRIEVAGHGEGRSSCGRLVKATAFWSR